MISIQTIESLVSFFSLGLTYVIGATTAGFMQAWIAQKMGDHSASQEGFLTWNPLVHIDPVGAFCFLYFGFGWSKNVPVNPYSIASKVKLFFVLFAHTLTYIALALISLLLLISFFGFNFLELAMAMISSGYISLMGLSATFPTLSSFALVIAHILVLMSYLSIMLAVFYCIYDGFNYVTTAFFPEQEWLRENEFARFFLPLLLVLIFSRFIRIYLIYSVTYAAYLLAHIAGAA